MIKSINVLAMGEDFLIGENSLSELREGPVKCSNTYIVFCVSGTAQVEVNMRIRTIEKDCLLFIFPNDVVNMTDYSSDFMTLTQIYSPSFVKDSCNHLELVLFPFLHEHFYFVISSEDIKEYLATAFKNLFSVYNDRECHYRDEIIQLQLRIFFLAICDSVKRSMVKNGIPVENRSNRAEYQFKRFITTIFEHYKESREVLFYANELCITPKYLNSVAKKIAGVTAKEVIDHHTVAQLKITIRQTDKSMQEITDEYNFPNQSYFGRYFRNHVGSSPIEFRRNRPY